MKTIIDRLVMYMNFKGLNANNITVDASLSNGLIGKAIKNNKGLNSETIEKLLSAYRDINPEWLMTGEGEMLKNAYKNYTNDVNETKSSYGSDKDLLITTQKMLIEELTEKVNRLQKEISAQKKYQENH
jgi:hypothetical protein